MRTKNREPGQPGAALQVKDPQPLPQIPVRLRLEGGRGPLSPLSNYGVGGLVQAVGDLGQGQVGKAQQQLLKLALHLGRLLLQASGALCYGGDVAAQVSQGVVASLPPERAKAAAQLVVLAPKRVSAR